MEKQEALEHLKQNTEFSQPEVLEKLEGKHNQNFIFNSEEGNFVLRKNLETVEELSLKSERRLLEFLEDENIDFIPESIYYDEKRDIHIIEFVGKEEAYLTEIEDKLLEELAVKLAEIHSIDFEDYRDFCQRKGYKPDCPDMRRDILDKAYSYLEVASRHLDRKDLIKSVERKADQIDKYPREEKKIYLAHGDLAGSVRKGEKRLYFIDWEFAGFTVDPEHDLGDLFLNRDLAKEKIEKIKQTYMEERDEKVELEEEIDDYREIFPIFQTSWLLKKAAELKKAEDEEWQRYLRMAEEKL